MFLGPAKTDKNEKIFHVFHKDEVVAAIASDVTFRNSKARSDLEMDDQKVTFRSALHGKNIGEIEDRHDSEGHYRKMKFRLNSKLVFDILTQHITGKKRARPQVITHGKAVRLFK